MKLEGSIANSQNSQLEMGAMSYEFGSQAFKVAKEDFEIGKGGMKNLTTGEMIVGNITDDELEYGRVLGNGAAGYVYAAVHKPTGRQVAIKSINVFDQGKRHQLINDLRSLSNHTCPFLV
jgi:serine/threonine protein kinase